VKRRALQRLLRDMRGRRVLVVGDVMLDEFWWGRVARISPEAPVPVVEVDRQSDHPGGAANVALNVRALGGEATVVGAVGGDAAAARLAETLHGAGIETLLSEVPHRPTTVKTRVVAHHQQVVRADRETRAPLPPAAQRGLVSALATVLPHCDAVVVSDYDKGVVTMSLMSCLRRGVARHRVPLLIDPKVPHLGLYRGADIITPNLAEAARASGLAVSSSEELRSAAERLLRRLSCRALLVTRGEHGMALFRPGKRLVEIPASAREVYDVTGAGDTVIATLSLALAAGASEIAAARLANRAAGIAVGKLGTATVTPDDLLAHDGS
jgi:D-beta-D-heptose 7-phosphate kinase/D-beta-D-heptose 1-phosphate adenosyltransferase